MSETLAFLLVATLLTATATFGFERLAPDFGYAPVMGNTCIGASFVLLIMVVSYGAWQLWIVPTTFFLAGVVCKVLEAVFPRWSQTPEGKMRLAAELENQERDELRDLQTKCNR